MRDNNCEGGIISLNSNNLLATVAGEVLPMQAIGRAYRRVGCKKCRSTLISVSYEADYDICVKTAEREEIVDFFKTQPAVVAKHANIADDGLSMRLLEDDGKRGQYVSSPSDHKGAGRVLQNGNSENQGQGNNISTLILGKVNDTSGLANCLQNDVMDETKCAVCDDTFFLNYKTRACSNIPDCKTHFFKTGENPYLSCQYSIRFTLRFLLHTQILINLHQSSIYVFIFPISSISL